MVRASLRERSSRPSSRPVEVDLGDLRPTRDFTFVKDTAQAFLAVGGAEADQVVGKVFNCGTGSEISIGDLVSLIGEIAGRPVVTARREERVRPADSEVQRLICDSGRLRQMTGWAPTRSLREGLMETMAWFQEPANLSRYKLTEYAQ